MNGQTVRSLTRYGDKQNAWGDNSKGNASDVVDWNLARWCDEYPESKHRPNIVVAEPCIEVQWTKVISYLEEAGDKRTAGELSEALTESDTPLKERLGKDYMHFYRQLKGQSKLRWAVLRQVNACLEDPKEWKSTPRWLLRIPRITPTVVMEAPYRWAHAVHCEDYRDLAPSSTVYDTIDYRGIRIPWDGKDPNPFMGSNPFRLRDQRSGWVRKLRRQEVEKRCNRGRFAGGCY